MFKIDYNKDLPPIITIIFEFFSQKLPDVVREHNGLLEKSHIKWFSFDDIWRNRKTFRPFYQEIIDILLDKEEQIKKGKKIYI